MNVIRQKQSAVFLEIPVQSRNDHPRQFRLRLTFGSRRYELGKLLYVGVVYLPYGKGKLFVQIESQVGDLVDVFPHPPQYQRQQMGVLRGDVRQEYPGRFRTQISGRFVDEADLLWNKRGI